MIVTNQDWKIVDAAMQDVMDKLRIEAPNTGNILEFDIDGYWTISDPYDRKPIKRYKKFVNAIDYLLLND